MDQFTQSIVLLLLTALLSGLGVPIVINIVQARSQRRAKVHEAELARQSKVIEQQEALIHKLADLLWEFQLAIIAPLYYHQFDNVEAYESAKKRYLDDAGRLLGLIRAEIGKAVRLTSPEMWSTLKELYYSELLVLDSKVTQLLLKGESEYVMGRRSPNWGETQKYILESFAKRLDSTVDQLSVDLGLKYDARARTQVTQP